MTAYQRYARVDPTPEEIAAYRHKWRRIPAVYRYEYRECGTRLWGSGLGIGSHNRKHREGRV